MFVSIPPACYDVIHICTRLNNRKIRRGALSSPSCTPSLRYASSTLARYAQCPRQGHMKAALMVCGKLSAYTKIKINADTPHPIPVGESVKGNYTEFYERLTEEIATVMAKPKREGSNKNCKCRYRSCFMPRD